MSNMDDEVLEDLYAWVDQIPLTRPKKNIQRDFSDGVLVAEIVKHFCPGMVEIHNYAAASSSNKKLTNWSLLNRKVFKKLGFEITDDVIQNIANCKQMAVEQFLMLLRRKIDRHLYEKGRSKPPGAGPQISDRPEADQNMPTDNATPSFSDVYSPNMHNTQRQHEKLHGSGLHKPAPVPPIGGGQKPYGVGVGVGHKPSGLYNKSDYVSKMAVEEKEQELLAKDETIQILQAKVRRLEHLLHLKDIRIDDLQSRLDRMGMELRPTAKYKK